MGYKMNDDRGRPYNVDNRGNVRRGGRVVGGFQDFDDSTFYVEKDRRGRPVRSGVVGSDQDVSDVNTGRSMGRVQSDFGDNFGFVLILIVVTALFILLGAWAVWRFEDYIPTFFVAYADGQEWEDDEQLPIFENGYYEETKIHPGMAGSYQFRLQNENQQRLLYSLNFTETNEFGVNLKYRLKADDTYIAGDEKTYLTAKEISQKESVLAAEASTIFTLEWKWVDGANDAYAGMNNANYILHIKFSGKIRF